MVNGCFDVLHYGHLEHLREARSFGDRLIVALTEDAFVNKGPGKPVNRWQWRAEMLRELRCVDEVFPSKSAVEAILAHRPDVFVKGIDYANGQNWTEDVASACSEVGAELRFTATVKRSASDIIRKALA